MGDYKFNIDKPVGRYNKSDSGFLISVILLLGLGLFTLYFCSQSVGLRFFNDSFYFIRRQAVSVFVGVLGFSFFSLCPLEKFKKLIPAVFAVTIILCLLTYIPFFSVERNGARRWLKIPFGGFTLQTSEIVKFTLVVYLANYFDGFYSKYDENRSVFIAVLTMLIMVTFVLTQKDFSTSFFLYFFACAMFWCCKMKSRWFWFVSFIVGLLFVFYILSQQYRIERIIAFLNPTEDLSNGNYQSMSSKKAISAGGVWGSGIGSSLVQSNKIPEVQTDYIFASWAEAMGLFGVIAYFLLLGFFAFRGLKIAFTCKNRFAAFGSFGFIIQIVFQSLMNIGVVAGALPATGIPLPFFSSGGSSVIVTLCMCGFVLNASRFNSENNREKILNESFVRVDSINGVNVYE